MRGDRGGIGRSTVFLHPGREEHDFPGHLRVLREGTAIRDFTKPSLTVVGGDDPGAVQRVGALYEPLGVGGAEVMHTPCRDIGLNVSSAYLKPGFAFGGSCLRKDLRTLRAIGRGTSTWNCLWSNRSWRATARI